MTPQVGGEDGPAKCCGQIHLGDTLTHVDGVSADSFGEMVKLLNAAADGPHTLIFQRGDDAGEMDAAAAAEVEARRDGERALAEARQLIHAQKERFYLPPDKTGDNEMVYCCLEVQCLRELVVRVALYGTCVSLLCELRCTVPA